LIQATSLCRGVVSIQHRFSADFSCTAFLAPLVSELIADLSFRDLDQQMPEILAVLEVGKLALPGAQEEALESLGHDILLVGDPPRGTLELLPRQTDQPFEIAIPDLRHGCLVTSFQVLDPPRYRLVARHFDALFLECPISHFSLYHAVTV
jgi:hypothetical protein